MNRSIYIDTLRAVACIAVIVVHISGGNEWYSQKTPTFDWIIMNIYDSLVRWCVPIFLMISGALFLNPEKKNISLQKLYTHNILRIVTAFVFWSSIYALYNYYTIQNPTITTSLIVPFLSGHFHMWFLWLIAGLYMLVPILRLITQNKEIMKYFLLISLVFSFAIPFFFKITDICIPMLQPLTRLGKGYCENLHLHMLSGYTFYFVLGYYLHTTSLSRKTENFLIALGIGASICIATFSYYLFYTTSIPHGDFYEYNTLLVLLEATAVFIVVKRRTIKENSMPSIIISQISKRSFGIYLIHMLVIEALGITATSINPIFGIPLFSILVLAISYGVISILARIPIINKWAI